MKIRVRTGDLDQLAPQLARNVGKRVLFPTNPYRGGGFESVLVPESIDIELTSPDDDTPLTVRSAREMLREMASDICKAALETDPHHRQPSTPEDGAWFYDISAAPVDTGDVLEVAMKYGAPSRMMVMAAQRCSFSGGPDYWGYPDYPSHLVRGEAMVYAWRRVAAPPRPTLLRVGDTTCIRGGHGPLMTVSAILPPHADGRDSILCNWLDDDGVGHRERFSSSSPDWPLSAGGVAMNDKRPQRATPLEITTVTVPMDFTGNKTTVDLPLGMKPLAMHCHEGEALLSVVAPKFAAWTSIDVWVFRAGDALSEQGFVVYIGSGMARDAKTGAPALSHFFLGQQAQPSRVH